MDPVAVHVPGQHRFRYIVHHRIPDRKLGKRDHWSLTVSVTVSARGCTVGSLHCQSTTNWTEAYPEEGEDEEVKTNLSNQINLI